MGKYSLAEQRMCESYRKLIEGDYSTLKVEIITKYDLHKKISCIVPTVKFCIKLDVTGADEILINV